MSENENKESAGKGRQAAGGGTRRGVTGDREDGREARIRGQHPLQCGSGVLLCRCLRGESSHSACVWDALADSRDSGSAAGL